MNTIPLRHSSDNLGAYGPWKEFLILQYKLYQPTFISFDLNFKEMDVEKFSCKTCSFVSERLEELNCHIESNHSNHDPSEKKQEPNSLTGLYTEVAFHQTLDALESRNPPVKVKFVLAAVISEAPKTKRGRKKAGKDSIGFSIVDMRKFPSWQSTLSSDDQLDNVHYRQTSGQKLYTTYKLNEMFIFSTKILSFVLMQ